MVLNPYWHILRYLNNYFRIPHRVIQTISNYLFLLHIRFGSSLNWLEKQPFKMVALNYLKMAITLNSFCNQDFNHGPKLLTQSRLQKTLRQSIQIFTYGKKTLTKEKHSFRISHLAEVNWGRYEIMVTKLQNQYLRIWDINGMLQPQQIGQVLGKVSC